jgi:transposase-like protein
MTPRCMLHRSSLPFFPSANATEPLLPSAWHHVEQYENNPIEADHGQLKRRLRPMRGLQTDRTAEVVRAGHAFVQSVRRGHYDIAIDTPPATRLAAAFAELARAI